METRETILKELESISPVVANISSGNVFSVPGGYFNDLPGVILSRVKNEPVQFGERKEPFGVPVGYFEGFAAGILQKIKNQGQSVEAELNELAPILNTISKRQVYTVPEGYFESLELTIPLKLARPSAKVFSFGKTRKLVRYAVAACTMGILAVGAYLFINKNNSNDTATVISYEKAKNMNVSKELDKLSETEIATYLDTAPTIGYALNVAPEEVNFDDYLDAASDEEINEYLNESAGPSAHGI